MPQLNKGFSKSKMNKDMDERVVPTGEYRDALNVQISSSDDSDVGSAQSLLGNVLMSAGMVPVGSTCVGSIAHNKEDKIYYLVAGPRYDQTISSNTEGVWKDYIIEYDVKTESFKYVFVDIYRVHLKTTGTSTSRDISIALSSPTLSVVRKEMIINGFAGGSQVIYSNDSQITEVISQGTPPNTINIYSDDVDYNTTSVPSSTLLQCTSKRILNFSYACYDSSKCDQKDKYITGINIIDDMLFWTDNDTEPKKINITRSISGTGGTTELPDPLLTFNGDNADWHTRLCITPDSHHELRVKKRSIDNVWYVAEENVTVIKKGPRTPPRLIMSKHEDDRDAQTFSKTNSNPSSGISGPPSASGNSFVVNFGGTTNPVKNPGDTMSGFTLDDAVHWKIGDMILMNQDYADEDDANSAEGFTEHDVRATVTSVPGTVPNNSGYELTIQSIDRESIDEEQKVWRLRLEEKKPMFEFKFVRFAYRYKYEDGEFSTYSPFSELAFLPGEYDYLPKKGFNLGMTNRLRQLKIADYITEDSERPQDVVQVDLLYKDESSPNIYTVESIKMTDGWSLEGEKLWPDPLNHPSSPALPSWFTSRFRGEYEVTSELINATVPSNQLLRPWDNVPRKALAQEITSNRLVYGNYVQNFDVTHPWADNEIKPIINVNLFALDAPLNAPEGTSQNPLNGEDNLEGFASPVKTCRSLRTYQVGVVYGDEYGRETPVLAGKKGTGSLTIDVKNSSTINKLRVDIGSNAPTFAYYYKLFVKETSNEFYNMAMDRWYDAEDGNIWLSFASADRNKVDGETFIILKKKHDSHEPVTDPARYKILAIENEAPDFIKTNTKSLGQVTGTIGSSTIGFPLEDYDKIRFDGAISGYDDVLGAGSPEGGTDLMGKIHAGTLWMRARTVNVKSDWYQVSNMKGGTTAGGQEFKSDKPFGPDMAFTSTDGTYAGRVAGVKIEFADRKVENKKEFEGRFFVKIYKDLVLIDNLLTSAEPEYRVTSAAKIGYFNMPKGKGYKISGASGETNWERCGVNNEGDLLSGASGNCDGEDCAGLSCSDNELFFKTAMNGFKDGAGWGATCAGMNSTQRWTRNSGGRFHFDAMYVRGAKASNGYNCDPDRECLSDNCKTGCTRGLGVHGAGGVPQGSMDIGYITSGIYKWYSQDDKDFMALLKTAGTNFRFREDEEGIVYTVKNSYGTNPNGDGLSPDCARYGAHHCFHEKSDGDGSVYNWGPSGNNKWRWRIDFERADMPGVALPDPQSTEKYHPLGGKAATKTPGVQELGYWGGRHKHEHWRVNINDPRRNSGSRTMRVPTPPGYGGGSSGMTILQSSSSGMTRNDGDFIDGRTQTCRWRQHASKYHYIEIVEPIEDEDSDWSSKNPAVWETEPKEDVGMDIYYEASPALPIRVDYKTNEQFAPYGSIVMGDYGPPFPANTTIISWSGNTATLSNSVTVPSAGFRFVFLRQDGLRTHAIHKYAGGTVFPYTSNVIQIRSIPVPPVVPNVYSDAPHNQPVTLAWHNAYAFGNGIESDRIRDDYNQKTITNGVKASTVMATPYKEERRKTGLIHSGIYNSTSGVNNLNQFIAAEKITKDMNPSYGSIQKLHTRDSNIVVLHEDKCMKVLADKNALFNADGKSNVAVSSNFLGSDQPFATKYGISTNPESCAVDLAGRLYFADRSRGAVLRLSNDGITNISDYGMKDWFNDHLNPHTTKICGSFDQKKSLYNITITGKIEPKIPDNEPDDDIINEEVNGCGCDDDKGDGRGDEIIHAKEGSYNGFESSSNLISFSKTLSFSENSKGWISFKSFIPENGLSINNNYYTFKNGHMYRHHYNEVRNYFYGVQYDSSLTVLFNDNPSSVKSFATLNYEGTQARITSRKDDKEYFNLNSKNGWYVDNIITDLQDTGQLEFKEKEGKWFSYIKGSSTSLSNLDEIEFSVQGIGMAAEVSEDRGGEDKPRELCLTIEPLATCGSVYGCMDPSASNYNPNATVDDGSCAVVGCMDPNALNYNPNATVDDPENCIESRPGCTDTTAVNYNANANVDDGSCYYSCDCDNGNDCGFLKDKCCVETLVMTDPSGSGQSTTTSSAGATDGGFGFSQSNVVAPITVLQPTPTYTDWETPDITYSGNTVSLWWGGLGEGTYEAGFIDANGCEWWGQMSVEDPIGSFPCGGGNVFGCGTCTSWYVDYPQETYRPSEMLVSHQDFGMQGEHVQSSNSWVQRDVSAIGNPIYERITKILIRVKVGVEYPNNVIEAWSNLTHVEWGVSPGMEHIITSIPSTTSSGHREVTSIINGVSGTSMSAIGIGTFSPVYPSNWNAAVDALNSFQDNAGNPVFSPALDSQTQSIEDVYTMMDDRGGGRYLETNKQCCTDVFTPGFYSIGTSCPTCNTCSSITTI